MSAGERKRERFELHGQREFKVQRCVMKLRVEIVRLLMPYRKFKTVDRCSNANDVNGSSSSENFESTSAHNSLIILQRQNE